jgi:hypothetical protein
MASKSESGAPGQAQAGGTARHEEDHASDRTGAPDPDQKEGPERIGQVSSLDDIPAVAAYLKRIGATAISFWSARVIRTDAHGYPETIGTVKFERNGTVSVIDEADPPTAEEQEAITTAFARVDFPKLVTLKAIAEPPPGVNLSDRNVWVCHDFRDEIVMVLQRYDTKGGGKGFIPWTRWSDGLWRKMEPDTLPFFGTPGFRNKSVLVLHEGAKAAARLKRLQSGAESADRFPWFAELEHAHHVGWLGGVYAIERSEWDKLRSHSWSRIIIVADNEQGGVKAARSIAKLFPANVWILAFDQRFAPRFDLADEWPAEMFDDRGRYIGPPMRDFLLPATQATFVRPAEGRGRPSVVLRDEFAAQVAYTVEPERIVFLHNPSRDLRPEQFNTMIAPLSDAKDTAAKVFARLECQYDRLVYHPGYNAGPLTLDGSRCFNVHEGGGIAAVPGDDKPWTDYLAHLFPVAADRAEVERLLATLIACPGIRMTYGMLLISATQGVGKSTLGNILRALLGWRNVSFPNESAIVDSSFNGWIARKRLVFLQEFYSGRSRRTYDKLKTLVTDETVHVNEKFTAEYDLENWAHFIACSNSEAALHLDDEDRRWLVPTVTEKTRAREEWAAFHEWLARDGLGIIVDWAERIVAERGAVRTGDHAPMSSRKRLLIEGSRSEGERLAMELGEHLVSLDRQVILRTADIRAWIAVRRGFARHGEADLTERRLEKSDTILRALKKVPGITVWADSLRPKFGATRDSIVMNFAPAPEEKWADIKDQLTTPEGADCDEPL